MKSQRMNLSFRRKKMENSMLIRLMLRNCSSSSLMDALEDDVILNPADLLKEEVGLYLFLKIMNPEASFETYCKAIAEYLYQKFQLSVAINDFELMPPCKMHGCMCPHLSSLRVVDTYNLLDYLPPFYNMNPEELAV